MGVSANESSEVLAKNADFAFLPFTLSFSEGGINVIVNLKLTRNLKAPEGLELFL